MMPIVIAMPVLQTGFMPMFNPLSAPPTTSDAAMSWATAYVNYVNAGGIFATPKKASLVSALTSAFNPELSGGGPAALMAALASFWVGLQVPAQAGAVLAFIPAGSTESRQPSNATPEQQAIGLATVIHNLTMMSVWVKPHAPPVPPMLIL